MKIGVIGTGNIGGTLARKLSAAGHDVRVANSRGLEGVRAFADEIGASAVDTRGAVEGADVIVISIPFPAVAELPKDLFDTVPQDVPVVDTGNYYPGMRDTQIAEIDAGMPQSVWVARQTYDGIHAETKGTVQELYEWDAPAKVLRLQK